MQKETKFIEDKNMEEEIRLLKNFVLDRISAISFRLGRVSCKANVALEYGLVKNAIDFLSNTNVSDKETFQKLLAFYYIFVGMDADFDGSITCSMSEYEQ